MPFYKAAHRKVRTGCAQCKKRRIKCDETRPRCLNCVRYPSECSFELRPASLPQSSAIQTSTELTVPSLTFPDNPEFSFADFELMHHWTISTSVSLAANTALQQAMREVVPRLAMEQKYLMHALMSLSALHISKLRQSESRHYLLLAAHHQSVALPLMRSALTSITEENCHALYACGHIVTKYAFASPQPPDSLVLCLEIGRVSQFLPLIRGAFSVYSHSFEWLASGPLGSCLEVPLDEHPDFHHNPEDASLEQLLTLLRAKGTNDAITCCEALSQLRTLFAMIATPNQTMSTKTLVYCWPAQVSEEYIAIMSQRKPEAILVLAHYCILLKLIDSFWFMKGCAARLLDQCRKDLSMDWQPYILWPLAAVGLE